MKPLLLSVDVEDLLERFPEGARPNYPSHVPAAMIDLLNLFKQFHAKVTCFICGDLARAFPKIVQKIEAEGHEIACHSDLHIPLDKLTPDTFKQDLKNNIEALRQAGVSSEIVGFRAPIFSLTEKTSWAYDVLRDLGFLYSSSVLPAINPQYGWPEFGEKPKMVSGILEIPMTVENFLGLKVPLGGMYLRWLPLGFIKKKIKEKSLIESYLSFIHPYDLDLKQEYFKHPGVDNLLFHFLLKARRGQTIPRIREILRLNYGSITYKEFASKF
jgi:hypothetical protein